MVKDGLEVLNDGLMMVHGGLLVYDGLMMECSLMVDDGFNDAAGMDG